MGYKDDILKRLAKNGGLFGVHFLAPYYYRDSSGNSDITIDDVLDHIEHAVAVMGIDHVALGCDYFPDSGGWHDLQAAQNSLPIRYIVEKDHFHDFTVALLARGFSEDNTAKILGANYLRFCREVMN
jgi:microsomal dipeptidase-like Zn-dependent dipeptidase